MKIHQNLFLAWLLRRTRIAIGSNAERNMVGCIEEFPLAIVLNQNARTITGAKRELTTKSRLMEVTGTSTGTIDSRTSFAYSTGGIEGSKIYGHGILSGSSEQRPHRRPCPSTIKGVAFTRRRAIITKPESTEDPSWWRHLRSRPACAEIFIVKNSFTLWRHYMTCPQVVATTSRHEYKSTSLLRPALFPHLATCTHHLEYINDTPTILADTTFPLHLSNIFLDCLICVGSGSTIFDLAAISKRVDGIFPKT